MDYNADRSIPFEIANINHGFQEAKGLLKLMENELELEFEVQDSLIGFFKSGVNTVRIHFSNLQSIEFQKGWFSAKVVLEATSMKVFKEIPGTEQAICELKVKRKYWEEAKSLISRARMLHSEYKLEQLEG